MSLIDLAFSECQPGRSMQVSLRLVAFTLSLAVGACSSESAGEDGSVGDGAETEVRPWDAETQSGVAASGELAITLSTGTFEAPAHTSSFIPSRNIFRIAGIRTEEDLWITVEIAADSMASGATLNCGPGGDAEVRVSLDLDEFGTRGVFSSHDGPACEVFVSSFEDVGGVVTGTFSGLLFDTMNYLDLNVSHGYFETTRGSVL